MTKEVTEILSRLSRLSITELTKVEQAIKAMISLGGGHGTTAAQHGAAEPWGEHLLDCIIAVSRDSVGYPIGKDTLRGMQAYQSFRKKLPELIEYIEHAAPEFHQRRAICSLGVELLFNYLHKPEHWTGPSTLMYQIHRMPAALDAQFPSYAKMGLLGLIARREQPTVS